MAIGVVIGDIGKESSGVFIVANTGTDVGDFLSLL